MQASLGAIVLAQQTFHAEDTPGHHDGTGSPCYIKDHRQLATCPPNSEAQTAPARCPPSLDEAQRAYTQLQKTRAASPLPAPRPSQPRFRAVRPPMAPQLLPLVPLVSWSLFFSLTGCKLRELFAGYPLKEAISRSRQIPTSARPSQSPQRLGPELVSVPVCWVNG